MSVKSELSRARKEYNATPTLKTLTTFKEREEEYNRTQEGIDKFREENGDSLTADILVKIVALNKK